MAMFLKRCAVTSYSRIPSRLVKTGGKRWLSVEARVGRVVEAEVKHGPKVDQWGRIFVGGAGIVGIGSLCFYGLGLSKQTGAVDRARFWPKEVKKRISHTYSYFAGGLGVTAVAAVAASRARAVVTFMATRPILSVVTFLVGTIGSSLLCYSIPYEPETIPAKIGAFGLFSSIMGASLAPILLIGGPVISRAAAYTACVVGGLSATAACAPSDKFLYMAGPLSLGLGVVVVASLGGLFMTPGSMLFSGLNAISLYGGLVLFGGFLLYDTQKIIYHAESAQKYDPVNASIGIYLDTINIFIRMVAILMNGNSRRK